MYKHLLLIILIALTGCGKLDETSPPPVKEKLSLEEWKKANNFNDKFYIESVKTTVLYNIIEQKDTYLVAIDLLPDTSFIRLKTDQIMRQTGLTSDEIGVYYSMKPLFIPGLHQPPTSVALSLSTYNSFNPLPSPKKWFIVDKSEGFLDKLYIPGNPFTFKFTISPIQSVLSDLKKNGTLTAENKSTYVFEDFVGTFVAGKMTHEKSSIASYW